MTEAGARLRAFAYLNADKTALYRAIMRVFVDAKTRFTLHLRPHEVTAALGGAGGAEPVGAHDVEVALAQLCDWGNLEAHPDDFIERTDAAVDLVRGIDSTLVRYVFCAPHTFHLGGDVAAMIEYAAPVLAHVHVADVFDHRASSGLRYIVNPPGSPARVHQHLDIGQGEVDFDALFGALRRVGFDGILTSCVFAWEERAVESSRFMLERIEHHLAAGGAPN